MDLKSKDVCGLLGIDEKTLRNWIKEKKIPSYEIQHQHYFNKAEIHEWILKNNWPVLKSALELTLTNEPVSLSGLLEKGGIYTGIPGKDAPSVIRNSVKKMILPSGLKADAVIATLLEREEMMPTAVGKGIAIPHPRNPIVSDIGNESVSLCFLKEKVDFGALDKQPVTVLFIVLCANAKRHLEILSKISYLCQDPLFGVLTGQNAERQDIMEYIRKKEKDWIKR